MYLLNILQALHDFILVDANIDVALRIFLTRIFLTFLLLQTGKVLRLEIDKKIKRSQLLDKNNYLIFLLFQ